MKVITLFLFVTIATGPSLVVPAQSGPRYEITQSVTAGGGTTSTGGAYSATGTVGQSILGANSTGRGYSVRAGFWQGDPLTTAALVPVSGSVFSSGGHPIRNVRLVLSGSGGATRSAITSAFGYFRFDEVEVGQTYIIIATHKHHEFSPRVITVSDEITDLTIRSIAAR